MTQKGLQPVAAPQILVIVAHPDLASSRVNRAMMQAARNVAPHVQVRDLYALYPDYVIDVALEQSLLVNASLVVWQHPIHWYHMPPLMKLWLDEVLDFGWAYGAEGIALQGKDLWLAASTGGPESSYRPDSYNRYLFDAFLPPYEQTAALCSMRFLAPLVLHGAQRASDAEIAAHTAIYVERLSTYPDWPELAHAQDCVACTVPADARPRLLSNTKAA